MTNADHVFEMMERVKGLVRKNPELVARLLVQSFLKLDSLEVARHLAGQLRGIDPLVVQERLEAFFAQAEEAVSRELQ